MLQVSDRPTSSVRVMGASSEFPFRLGDGDENIAYILFALDSTQRHWEIFSLVARARKRCEAFFAHSGYHVAAGKMEDEGDGREVEGKLRF